MLTTMKQNISGHRLLIVKSIKINYLEAKLVSVKNSLQLEITKINQKM